MVSVTSKSVYWRGVRAGLPFIVVAVPFAFVFGVVATEAGLDVVQTFAFSFIVIAGAAQVAAIQLMTEQAPGIVVVFTALAVNLRMAMYSASLTTHVGPAPFWQRAFIAYLNVDQSYAMSVAEFDRAPDMTVSEKVRYFFGVVTPVAPMWYAGTLLGALVGQQIPPEWALDFAVPITFLAILAPMLRTFAHVAAAVTSVAVALSLAWIPYSLGLLVAGVAAMMVVAEIERRREGRS